MTARSSIPLGHTIPAHRVFGWCAYCSGRTPAEELAAWQTRELRRMAAEAQPGRHVYLSTGCLHEDHTYCQSMTGKDGAKRPGTCKFCAAPCVCSCHRESGADEAQQPTRCDHSFPDPFPASLDRIGDCRYCGISYQDAKRQSTAAEEADRG